MKSKLLLSLALLVQLNNLSAQPVSIQVDASIGRKAISPYIYGKNNNLSDDPGNPLSNAQWQILREAGLRFTRENGGNNASKYNWRTKLTSHPDWYNNVYAHNWDYAAKKMQDSMPGLQGMWAFQLIGYAASNSSNNFNDWAYNSSQWWSGTCQNLAGGGLPDGGGSCSAQSEGNSNLYLEKWDADSTTNILDHWFGAAGLGYDKNKIAYWSMDNEPEIWTSTHDDVMKQDSAEGFMQVYFAVAKKARVKYPNIKLVGPVPCSEWFWYTWNNNKISYKGQTYVWLEYFIKRIAEEQAASGIRLLDVLDIHNYPNESNDTDIVQLNRMYFDTTYNYPGANGVKTCSPSAWDNSITKEYIFGRCNQWLNQYIGPNHGVTFSVSEFGFRDNNANVNSVCYGSTLGTFADNGVEFFTPWYWNTGMWETLHLYSRYSKSTRVQSVSNDNQYVCAYSSVNNAADSMTVILVNKSLTATHTATVNLANFTVPNGSYNTFQLSNLPSVETFTSHNKNALKKASTTVASNKFSFSLPPLSTTAVILKGTVVTSINKSTDNTMTAFLYPNPVSGQNAFVEVSGQKIIDLKVECINMLGQVIYSKTYKGISPSIIEIPSANIEQGVYVVNLSSADGKKWTSRLIKL